MKKIIIFALVAVLGLSGTSLVYAQSPSPEPTSFNSYEVFWPLSAGKTRASRTYTLKMWKENVRGWLIFGVAEKANYEVLRSTKRMLEAQVLIDAKNPDLAKETVEASNNLLELANGKITSLEKVPDEVKVDMKNRLDNLIKLVDDLSTKTDGDLNTQLSLNHGLIEALLVSISK